MLDVDPALLAETEERAELRGVLRAFLAATSTPEDVRKHMSTPRGYDEALWTRISGELGLPGLAIPEEYGGSGFTFADLATALEEAGRALLCAPLLSSTVLAGYTLLLADDEDARARYLPGIATGTVIATLAGYAGGAESAGYSGGAESAGYSGGAESAGYAGGGQVRAEPVGGGWLGDGSVDFVLDGHGADLLLVVARTAGGPALFACAAGAAGLRRRLRPVLDGTRPQALITLDRTPLTPIGRPGDAAAVVGRVLDIGRVAVAAEQVGGSAHALDEIVAYVRQRRQFDRPIGSFQAVKHRLADLLVGVEAARSAAALAVACVTGATTGHPPDDPADVQIAAAADVQVAAAADVQIAAAAAATVCSETYRRATAEYVQLLGGIGFTWEHPAHLYLRRAHADEVLFGTPDDHRARIGDLIGLRTA